MFFESTNALATFENYINMGLKRCLDIFVILYLDYIFKYSINKTDYAQHMCLVLEKLKQYNFFVKLSKCRFDVTEIDFWGFVTTLESVCMDQLRVENIINWPDFETHKNVQIFCGFCQFLSKIYRKNFPLNFCVSLNTKKSKKKIDIIFRITRKTQKTFCNIKHAFITANLLLHFDFRKKKFS